MAASRDAGLSVPQDQPIRITGNEGVPVTGSPQQAKADWDPAVLVHIQVCSLLFKEIKAWLRWRCEGW